MISLAMPQKLNQVDSFQSDDSQRQIMGVGQGTKSLPRLPRGWSRVRHETGLFLRSIGLGILVTAFQGFFTNNFSEPEKVAIRKSRVTALLRTLIHALPLGLAIFEIVLNWRGYYIGRIFNNQNYLQFAAKAHEIFMQASIATIILSYIRHQISAGKGMPFGAVLGALQFFQVSYLWSVEFWSAIISKDFQLKKKICFTVLVLSCIIVATTAGPSSANLLIARQSIWPRKSSYFAVNATFQDIWPDRFDDKEISSGCKKVRVNQINPDDGCPISGLFIGLYGDALYASMLQDFKNDNFQTLTHSLGGDFNIALQIATCRGPGLMDQLCASASQVAVLVGLIVDARALRAEEDIIALEGYHTLKESYHQPYTTASCITDTVQDSSDQAPLRFPGLQETASELERGRETFLVPGLTKGQSIHNIQGNSSQFHVDWVDLPQEVFGTGVPGAIVVHPQSSGNHSSYKITTCTLNAGWGSSSISTDSDDINGAVSRVTQLPPSWPRRVISHVDDYGYETLDRPIFAKISNFSYPQLHVNISKNWMDFINPTVILPDNSTTSPVNMMLSQLLSEPKEYEISWTLNLLLATALSATGMEYDSRLFEERAQASKSCKTCLVFEIKNSIYGWQYTARETTTKLAIAVMFTYCVLVFGHLIYCVISGVSSTAWDSVAELVVLAMNSSPTETLQNTCAGVVGKTVFQTRVRVLKTTEKHLELVFGEVKDPNADITQLVMNEKYGSIAVGREDEDKPLKMEGEGEIRKRAVG